MPPIFLHLLKLIKMKFEIEIDYDICLIAVAYQLHHNVAVDDFLDFNYAVGYYLVWNGYLNITVLKDKHYKQFAENLDAAKLITDKFYIPY